MIVQKKSLGQNFLTNPHVADLMIVAGELNEKDTVLEIGPGKGVLTEKFLGSAKTVVAVEKDTRLIPFLQEKFSSEIQLKKLVLIEGDALDILDELPLPKNYKVIANIPYYITGHILRLLLTAKKQPKCIVFLMQKEVAERIVSRDGKGSLLSMSITAFGTPKYVKTVKKGSFSPPPAVDSAILLVDHISRAHFSKISEAHFFTLLKAGFAHKRKLVASNLKGIVAQPLLDTLPERARPEELTLEQWKSLVQP